MKIYSNKHKEDIANFNAPVILEDEEALYLDSMEDEEVAALEESQQLFLQTINNIRRAVQNGVMSEQEGAEYEAAALAELTEVLGGEMGLEFDEDSEDDEDAEYSSSYSDIAEFEAGTNFGQALLELCADEYDDPIDGLVELADATGLSDEEVVGLIQGVFAPDDELATAIGSFFVGTSEDEDAFTGLMVLAGEAQEEALEEDEDEDGEEYDYEEGEDDEEAQYSSYKLNELESRIAEFEAASVISNTLSGLESEAERGLSEGWVSPHIKNILFGNFKRDEDRLARFSQNCVSGGVDAETQLYAIGYALEMLEQAGPLVKFGAYVDEPITEQEAEFGRNVEAQARLNFQLMKERA